MGDVTTLGSVDTVRVGKPQATRATAVEDGLIPLFIELQPVVRQRVGADRVHPIAAGDEFPGFGAHDDRGVRAATNRLDVKICRLRRAVAGPNLER